MPFNSDERYARLTQNIAEAKQKTIAETGFRETGIAWLGNEAGVVIIPPNERRHPAEAFWAYADINGSRQVIRLANYAADLTYSNKDRHKAVRIGIPPGQEFLGVLGIAPENAKVFGPALPNQVQAAKQTYLTPDRFQMLRLSPAGDRRLQIEAGWFYDGGTLRYIESGELVDLDSHYPGTTGETRIVLIGWAEDDTVTVLEGDPFVMTGGDSIMNHLPTADFADGDLPLGGAILVNGETTIEQRRVLPFLPFFRAIRDTGIIPLSRGGGGFNLSTIQGFLFYNLGTAYQVHCVGDQTAPPTVDDDETVTPNPFGVLSLWAMSVAAGASEDALYGCVDPSAGAAVWLRLDGSGGGGSMNAFTVAADSGASQTIADGNTLTIAGGTGIDTVASVTDTVTIALENTAVTPGSYTNPAITIDAQGRITAAANGSTYTDEQAQDAVGNILTDTSTINFTYNDGTPYIIADVNTDAITNFHLANMAALTVKVRASNSTGDPSDLAFTADGQFLVRRSSALTVDTLVAADIPNLAASKITSGQLALARGGTNADLSATGGTGQVLKQSSSGAAITVAALVAADIPSLAASIIASGQLALARGGTNADLSATGGSNQFLKQSSSGAAITVGAIASADINTALTTPGAIGGTTPAAGTFTALTTTTSATLEAATGGVTEAIYNHGTTTVEALGIYRSRGSKASPTIVSAGDVLAQLTGYGYDGGAYRAAGRIQIVTPSSLTPGSSDMPGQIEFYTTPDGSTTPALVAYIDSAGGFYNANMILNTASVAVRPISFMTNGSFRWRLRVDSTSESGSNAGSLFKIGAWDDSSNFLRDMLTMTRDTFLITLNGGLAHTGSTLGLFSATPISKPTVSGSRGANEALFNLMVALANLGLVTNSTTA